LDTTVVRAMYDGEAWALLEKGKEVATRMALSSIFGQGLWTPTDTPRSEGFFNNSLRIWAARKEDEVEVWMTKSPHACGEQLDDQEAVRTLKATLSAVIGEWRGWLED